MIRNAMFAAAVLLQLGLVSLTWAADVPTSVGVFRGSTPAIQFDVSPPLRSMVPLEAPLNAPMRELPERGTGLEGALGPQDLDAAVQPQNGSTDMPATGVSFNGPSNTSGVSPPDPVGDVGPNHYVAMSNLSFQIFNKSGTSLYGPALNNTLWAGFGGACQTENSGDPIVIHDQFADRWILTQFTSAGPTWFLCVAVSTTPDPTGTYYRYAISTGSNFPDYPKFGVGETAYYVATREFAGGSSYVGVGAYALNRAQMVAGNPAPQVISFLVPLVVNPYNIGDGLQPMDIDGATLPPAGRPHYYVGTMDNGGPYMAPQDALTLWKFQADFVTPANSSFTLANTLPVAAFDSIFPCTPTSRECIPQLNTSRKIDILSYRQRAMHRLAYRNFGTHESLVTNQSVEAVAGIAGLRWYEVRSPNASPVVFQQGTYAPGATDGIHRWMGSIAMDAGGNMGLGFSASNATMYPSIGYTGRLAADPLGTMPQGEGVVITGTGAQTGSSRWGDYTSMNIDPSDDCTFWYVNQYVPVTSSVGWQLRIGSFKFPTCFATNGFAPGATYVTSAANATPTTVTALVVVCPATGQVVVTGSGESTAKSTFAGTAFIGLAYSIARDSTATDNANVVQSSALAVFNGDANRDFLNVQRFDSCTPGQSNTYWLTVYATTPQTGIVNGSFVWNGRLTASAGPALSNFAAATTFVASASNATPTIVSTLPVVCPASGSVAVTGSGESAARSNVAGSSFIGLAYSISRDSTATDNGNVVQSSALSVFNGDANRDFLNVQRVDSCTPGATNTYRLTAYATTPQTGISSQSFVWNGRLTATLLPAATGFAGGTSLINSASNAAPTVVTSMNVTCPASGNVVVSGSGESAALSNFAGTAFIGLAYSIARGSSATDNNNVVQSSALATFNGDANRDFLNVQRADSCTPGQQSTYFLTAYATTPQTNISNGSFVWNGRLVAVLPP